jgi:hypothetical protein
VSKDLVMTRFFRLCALAAAPLLPLSLLPSAAAAELRLAMFEEAGCVWCERWNAEIGPIYPKTEEGRIAPLERFDIHEADYDALELDSRPYFTPTFILLDDGKELGRIEGYPGEDFFWALLEQMLAELPVEAGELPGATSADARPAPSDRSLPAEQTRPRTAAPG